MSIVLSKEEFLGIETSRIESISRAETRFLNKLTTFMWKLQLRSQQTLTIPASNKTDLRR